MIQDILDFIKKQPTLLERQWFIHPDMQIYLRNGCRVLYQEQRAVAAITVADIQITTPRQKLGTTFLEILHIYHNKEVTYIENVENRHLQKWLLENEYQVNHLPTKAFAPDYYKRKVKLC